MYRIPDNPSSSNGFSARESTYEESLKRFFDICYTAAGIIELRAPKMAEGTTFGFFSDHMALARVALNLSGQAPGVYTSINCVSSALLSRCANHTMIQTARVGVARDEDVDRLIALLIDGDSIRVKDTSSTDSEHERAIERVDQVRLFLKEEFGWPDPVFLNSGNGGHLRYSIDLPNTPENVDILHDVLISLSKKFTDSLVKIDTVTYNPSRVAKIPYTLACKGEASVERPHRMATILSLPDAPHIVTLEQLAMVAAIEAKSEPRSRPRLRSEAAKEPARFEPDWAADRIQMALDKDFKFYKLWHNDDCGLPSASEADESFCAKVAYYLGRDEWLIDVYFRQSDRMRDKWDEPRPGGTYGSITIKAALAKQTTFWEASAPKPGRKPNSQPPDGEPRRILHWNNLIPIWDKESHVEHLVEDIVVQQAINLFTGDSGQGKSVLATAIGGCVAWGKPFLGEPVKQRRVVYLDREQPLCAIKKHILDLGIERTDQFVYWENTAEAPADPPTSASLIQLARDEHALFIFDPLVAFFHGSEQDANQTREVMQAFRMLCDAGGTIILLHHSGKGESSKMYRGSSDIKASVDVAFMVEKLGDPAGLLKDVNLVPFKNRLGESKLIRLTFNGHEFARSDRPPSHQEKLDMILEQHPGMTLRKINELGMAEGIPKHKTEWLLAENVQSGRYLAVDGPSNSKRYYFRQPDSGAE